MENHSIIANKLDEIHAELLESSKKLRKIKGEMHSTFFKTETLELVQKIDSFILASRSALSQLAAEFRREQC